MRIRSLTYATEIDVLPTGAVVEDRGPYVVVRSPSNPTHFWGNFLLYRQPPAAGDRERWERDFTREIGASQHVAIGWDTVAGEQGVADSEFVAAGYRIETGVALVATPHELRAHARASRDAQIRMLDPAPGADEARWAGAVEVQVAGRGPGHSETDYRAFVAARMADRRARFQAGDGAWFVAETSDGQIVASCGIIVTAGRARYQSVDTLEPFRNRGIASRLVHDAGAHAIREHGAQRLVIVADAGYHALPLYQSLGFVAREQTVGVCWWPDAPHAARHPSRRGAQS
ncbi:MAG: putative acetyltransferase [Thermoleophilia bacterium]|nr:putative acetyltransferase [Thermoleophilia bacterium]